MNGIEYRDMSDRDLSGELVGKKIVKIDTENSTMTLHDGTVLKFHDVYDCCAWFAAELEEKNLTDNAITRVTTELSTSRDAPEAWVLHVLAADTNVVDVGIQGDSTSGYYCQSITLEVSEMG